jgi:hypothetical protein
MNKFYGAILLTLTIYSCNQTGNKEAKSTKITENMDSGYTVIKTDKLITANATKPYSTKNREATQFALDKNSLQEKMENFIIKISDKKTLVCDINNNILKDLSIIKQWTDKSGPSTVYDLKDKNGVEYSLDHYINYQKKNFLGLRFSNSLETYTDE